MSDRIAGIVLLVGAIVYGFGALRLKASFGSDPLGPKLFPLILAVALALMALAIIIRVDPDPKWFSPGAFLNLVVVCISFIVYAYLLVPLGFVAATAVETGFVSQRFGARWWQAAVTGIVASLTMYALFVYGLGIPLPLGWVFGDR